MALSSLLRGNVISNVANAANILTGNAKAQLVPEQGWSSGFAMPVIFSFNPNSVQLTKSNSVEGPRGVITTGVQDAVKASGNIRLQLNGGSVTGVGYVVLAVKTLVEWATPKELDANGKPLPEASSTSQSTTTSAGAPPTTGKGPVTTFRQDLKSKTRGAKGAARKFGLPILLFSWGLYGPLGANIPVTLEKVTVDYQRWDPLGIPIWAKLNLTLVEVKRDLPLTNPTSGGNGGRSMHTLQQGENVVQVANTAYGTPTAWRQVAEANNLDDPLRLKPGKRLMLPPREDL